MSKVTSKLQVTIPKAIAVRYGIQPGDQIEFRPAGAEIRVVPPRVESRQLSVAERLRLFDESMARQREREKKLVLPAQPPADRGWTREELYTRGWPKADEPHAEDSPGDPDREDQ